MTYKKFSITHTNNVPFEEVARFYLNQIKTSGTKTLHFHPLKKSPSAMANKFRLAVLKYLTHNNCYQADTDKRELEIVTEAALDAGYTIIDVPADDYDRKIYLPQIKAEAAQFDLLHAA